MPPELWVDPMAVAQSTFVHKACDVWRCSFHKAVIPYPDWRTHKTEIMSYTEHKSFHWCGGKVCTDMDRELRFWTWAQSTQQHKDLEWTMGVNFLGNRAYIFRCCIFLNLKCFLRRKRTRQWHRLDCLDQKSTFTQSTTLILFSVCSAPWACITLMHM